ncbi:MAG: patatin-like phospholipase family protein [Dehalococcoidia bacterium]
MGIKGMLWPAVEAAAFVILLVVSFVLGVVGVLVTVFVLLPPVWLAARLGGQDDESSEPPVLDPPDVQLRELLGEANADARLVDGVFEGGGVKAIAQIGAVAAAEKLRFDWQLLGGTSGGAIVAALLANGKSAEEIWNLLAKDDLSRILQTWYLPHERALRRRKYFVVPLLPGLVTQKAVVSGDVFLKIMQENLKNASGGPLTFGDLPYKATSGAAPHDYRLKIVATDVSRGRPIVLPDDLPQYWEAWERARKVRGTPAIKAQDVKDCFPVAEAVRMSMSIPFVFAPYQMHLNGEGEDDPATQGPKGRMVEIVDGGVSSNFPIWIFDRTDGLPPTRPTFGFLLDESRKPSGTRASGVPRIWTVAALARHVIHSGIGAMDKRLSAHNKYRTARLRTLGVETTDFGLDVPRQKELYTSGYEDATLFFRGFDWDSYVSRFRGGARSAVAAPPAPMAPERQPS